MRHFLVFLVCIIVIFTSCSSKKNQEDAAGKAAGEYYNDLIEGRFEDYVAGMANTDSIPGSYREQLITMAKQFVAIQKEERGGLKAAKVVTTVMDTTRTVAEVYLEISYGDSASEEVVLPLIKEKGKWKMK
jgi:hypothetical protein